MLFDFLFRRREMLPMPYKRELHCHILPGVDHGASTVQEALEYIKALSDVGVERFIFTPHHTDPTFLISPEEVEPHYQELCAEAKKAGLPVMLEGFSFEYRLDDTFLQMSDSGKWGDPACRLRPLTGRYLLIENSYTMPLSNLSDVIQQLQENGWFLIMAHPERYNYYNQQGLRAYERLDDLGVEFQCNMLSFTGYYGEQAQKTALHLLEEGLISYLGTDLHNAHHVELLQKYLRSKEYARLRDDLERAAHNDTI